MPFLGRWIRESCYFQRKKPHPIRKALGIIATFLGSGAIHIICIRLAVPIQSTMLYGTFFIANGMVVALESGIHTLFKNNNIENKFRSVVPNWMLTAYVLAVMSALGHFLLLPETTEAGVVDALLRGGMNLLKIQQDVQTQQIFF